tara:strand:+ start:75 stop:323 length:249 start_codon:yes stop_codon:yes gene_type:complete
MNAFIFKRLTKVEQADELIMMGLRLKEGVNLNDYASLVGHQIHQNKIDELISEDLILIDNKIVKTTKIGKLLTNYVIQKLLC